MNLSRLLIIFHGGEPLLIGANAIAAVAEKIRLAVKPSVIVDFSLQTNGTLLTEETLDIFERMNISVSLSLDGPSAIHDKHRLDHTGRPSHSQVEMGLKLLLKRPKIFSGVIGVIDISISPKQLLDYFNSFALTELDLLFPDANHNNPPPGKKESPQAYTDWILRCFNIWFDEYPHIRIRFFDSIFDSLVGLPSKTDALGFGDVSLMTIETDGSYHDLDVLKITYDGATTLNLGSLNSNSIEEALQSSQIKRHRNLLTKEGLSSTCQECAVVETCAGGAVPHRYSKDGFANPSIYCDEIYSLIKLAQKRLNEQLESEVAQSKSADKELSKEQLAAFEDIESSLDVLDELLHSWIKNQKIRFNQALSYANDCDKSISEVIIEVLNIPQKDFERLSILPSIITWTNVALASQSNQTILSIDGNPIFFEATYVKEFIPLLASEGYPQKINRADKWLKAPFGNKIIYESENTTQKALPILKEAYRLIERWNPKLLDEIKLIAPEVLFIKDLSAHPDKIVSFSDNSVPGAIYVTIKLGDKYISSEDLADSLLHEYRHQKLYLLQRVSDLVHLDFPLVPSPWREELRPPSGLFHALYVFTFLKKFWTFLFENPKDNKNKERAWSEITAIDRKIEQGVSTVRKTKLTKTGLNLLDIIYCETSSGN